MLHGENARDFAEVWVPCRGVFCAFRHCPAIRVVLMRSPILAFAPGCRRRAGKTRTHHPRPPFPSSVLGLAKQCNVLQPRGNPLHQAAPRSTHPVPRVASGSAVDRASLVGVILSYMRSDPILPQGCHEGLGVVSLVGAESDTAADRESLN